MIKEILTGLLSSPVTWGVLLVAFFVLISIIVFRTKNTKDDAVWHAIVGMAVNAFNVAEKAIPDSAGGALGKIDLALKTFNEEYLKRKGKAPTEDILNFAKDEWAVLANELKKK